MKKFKKLVKYFSSKLSPPEKKLNCKLSYSDESLSAYLMSTKFSAIIIITDNVVAGLYLDKIKKIIKKSFNNIIDEYILSPGEHVKTRATKESIEDFLLSKNYDKNICLLAVGGGVVTDLTGFVAATYYRGVSVVYYSTTLLGMVDASIGGKTAVNTSFGKNLIGIIKQPELIICNLECVNTLSDIEYRAAFAEIIKHALIADVHYYDFLLDNHKILLNRDAQNKNYFNFLQQVVSMSHAIKLNIVKKDEQEKHGLRHILNFGHSVGHAIEAMSNYKISHGYAVAIGMVVESYIAMKLNILSRFEYNNILEIINLFKLDVKTSKLDFDLTKFEQFLLKDKKNADSKKINMVLIKSIGAPFYNTETKRYTFDIELSLIYNSLKELQLLTSGL